MNLLNPSINLNAICNSSLTMLFQSRLSSSAPSFFFLRFSYCSSSSLPTSLKVLRRIYKLNPVSMIKLHLFLYSILSDSSGSKSKLLKSSLLYSRFPISMYQLYMSVIFLLMMSIFNVFIIRGTISSSFERASSKEINVMEHLYFNLDISQRGSSSSSRFSAS